MGPLLYLTLCSYRNRLRVRLRRLKEPRYFIGLLVGLGYVWFFFLRPSANLGGPQGPFQSIDFRLAVELAGIGFLYLLAASALLPGPGSRRPALSFTQADVQFLFPAPLSRKQLLRYKLLRAQVPILVSSLFMTFFVSQGSLATSWMVLVGVAMILTSLNLYLTAVSLNRGSRSLLRWLPAAIGLSATGVLVMTGVPQWGKLSSLHGPGEILSEIAKLASTGPAGFVLWPFRALVRLPLGRSASEFFYALPGPSLMLALGYVWVTRSKVRFEEGSAELADRIARIVKGQREPQKPRQKALQSLRTPFPLSPAGRPETAILWKNLIAAGRNTFSSILLPFFLSFVAGMGLCVMFLNFIVGATAIGVTAAMVYVFTVFLGPQIARMDLRQDLAKIEVLKTWPVSGVAIVRGEVMAPALILTAIAWLSAAATLAFLAVRRFPPSWVVAAALLTPGVILLQLLAQNAIAVIWPAWAGFGASRARGIDVMGQRLLMMAGLLLVLVLAVIPAVVAGGLAGLGIRFVFGGTPVVLPALVASAVLFAEAFIVSDAIGRLLDRTDISAMDPIE